MGTCITPWNFFLLLVGVGVDAEPVEGRFARTVAFFAELSYPLYMSHYMFMQVHRGWLDGPAREMSDLAVIGATALFYVAFLFVACAVMFFWNRVIFQARRYPIVTCSPGHEMTADF